LGDLRTAGPWAIPRKARLIYLYRDPRESIASLIDALQSGQCIAPPDLAGKPPIDVAVTWWEQATRAIVEALAARPVDTWTATTYQALTMPPQIELPRLAAFAGVAWDLGHGLIPRDPGKWREHQLAVLPRLSALASTNARAKLLVATALERLGEPAPPLHSPRAPD
jgi:hypothetical protein